MTRRELCGVGVAACAACCAMPVLAMLAGVGAAGLISSPVTGVGGLVIAASAAVAFIGARRHRQRAAGPVTDVGPVPVELTRRPPASGPDQVYLASISARNAFDSSANSASVILISSPSSYFSTDVAGDSLMPVAGPPGSVGGRR